MLLHSRSRYAIRDLEAELLDMVCYDVEIEPSLQPVTGEVLNSGANKAPDARLDVHCRGFWEKQTAAFFDIEFATQMRTPTGTSLQNRYTTFTKTKRRKSMGQELLKLNKEHSRH